MKPQPFALERFFARYEFSARYSLSSSDPQALTLGDVLGLEEGAAQRFAALPLRYTQSCGGIALREQIAVLYQNAGVDHILVHAGPQEAIFAFATAAFTRGDHLIVQFPGYQSHYSVAQAIGVEVSRWRCDLSREGSPDVGELEPLITAQTRAIVLTTPHNPTGYAFDRAQIERVVEIARHHGLWLFGDEVYRGTEREAPAIPAVVDLYERGVSLGGLSKNYGLPGLRIGWIATRDATLYAALCEIKDYLSICNSAPSEFLAELALRHGDALLQRVRRICSANLDLLDEFFARRRALFDWKRPRAGTTAFPRYLAGSSEAFCERLVREAGVLLVPSTLFDCGDEHLRIGYGREDLPEALAQLEPFLNGQMAAPRSRESQPV